MSLELALAMTRYLAFTGVALVLLRIFWEAVYAVRAGQPLVRIAINRSAYLPLVGVLAFYARALFFTGAQIEPTTWDVVVINGLYAAFFIAVAVPRRRRHNDPPEGRYR